MSAYAAPPTRAQTKEVIMNLLHLDPEPFHRTRVRLTNNNDSFNILLIVARESDLVLTHTHQVLQTVQTAKEALDNAEAALTMQKARLTNELEAIVDWVHQRHAHLHTGSFINLANLRRQTIPPVVNSTLTAFTAEPDQTPSTPLPRTNGNRVTLTTRNGRSRTSTGSSSTSSRNSRQQARSNRIAYPVRRATPAPSPRSPSPGFRGTRDAYLALQESRYGRDSDGEVREVDEYAGDVSEDDEVQEVSPENAMA